MAAVAPAPEDLAVEAAAAAYKAKLVPADAEHDDATVRYSTIIIHAVSTAPALPCRDWPVGSIVLCCV